MGDQSGIENGFMSGHGRTNSENDAVPTEANVESRNSAVPAEGQSTLSQAALLGMAVRQFGASQSATGLSASTVGLSRNASNYSTRSGSPQLRESVVPQRRRPEPPVTKATLSELDVTKIIHNPKLRHDINFDPELHFRPNLDGEKGRRKQEKANDFWTTLLEQLNQFVMNGDEFRKGQGKGDDWCLPSLLKAVKEIIQTLVPARDRDFLDEGLNIELLMQQFNRGTVDLEKLALWLSSVLKQHCAPMRDEWVDDMYNDLSNGNQTNDVNRLVKGMRSLLSVLEAMKLDVANHQIRCLRPVLIEDTVHFERRFFQKKIQTGKLDISQAKVWYDETRRQLLERTNRQADGLGELDVLFEGLLGMVRPCNDISLSTADASARTADPSSKVPSIFVFDEERLLKLRSDMLDAINLEICMRVYEQADQLASSFVTSVPAYAADDESIISSSDSSLINFNAPPSRPLSFISNSSDSVNSSPRNSALFNTQPVNILEAKMKSRNLYSSLLALLHTAPPASRPAQRWKDLTPALAVQIYRFLNQPPADLAEIEQRLKAVFDFGSSLYEEVQQDMIERLRLELSRRVKEFKGLSGVGLFSVATGGRINGPGRTWDAARDSQGDHDSVDGSVREAREEGGMDDMATRLAHLGILHWRVWAPLAYVDGDVTVDMDTTA